MKETKYCPINYTVKVIGNKWKPIILYHLLEKTLRFSEIKRLIPQVSQKVLTENLRDLEKENIILRTVFADTSIRVEYSLTDKGKEVSGIIKEMQIWGQKYE